MKDDTATSKLNRHALDSELTADMLADLLYIDALLLLFMLWSGAAALPLSQYLR